VDPKRRTSRSGEAAGRSDAAGLDVRSVGGPADPALAGRHVLGVTTFPDGSGPATWSGPGVHLEVPLVALGAGPVHEIWSAATEPILVREGGVSAAIAEDVLFGTVDVPVGPIADAAHAAFGDLLAFCARHDRPHPVRVWCVLPDIHGEERGLERYQAFCAGRSRAFEDRFGEDYSASLCASTAVGSRAGRAVVYFLAGLRPGEHVENPRQVSAYSYPACHGPRSPSFARATRVGGRLFVSGTASIVGHESLHVGDVGAQVDETLDNIDVLRRAAEPSSAAASWKVYVRHPADAAEVLAKMRRRVGSNASIVTLVADICRRELLVEIEAVLG
jgi:chorismate lyase/3-hydroxybenzoate synthase